MRYAHILKVLLQWLILAPPICRVVETVLPIGQWTTQKGVLPLNQQTHVAAPHRVTRITRLPPDFIYFLNYGHWIMKCLKEISNSVMNMIADVTPAELHMEMMTHDRLHTARNTLGS